MKCRDVVPKQASDVTRNMKLLSPTFGSLAQSFQSPKYFDEKTILSALRLLRQGAAYFGNPAGLLTSKMLKTSPVALRPDLAIGLPLSV